MFSILQLSDLHRSEPEPISNDTLIASLLADRNRFPIETPAIRQPDAMIVSGDIVEGVQLGQSGYSDALKKQYAVARDFLARLTERFFAGDHSRVVLVPGNHDCCWNTAFSGMTPVAEKEVPTNLIGQLELPNSPLRWSWRERKLYEISNPDAYARRLDNYWDFVEGFYSGVKLKFPIRRDTGYNLFELDEGRILVAAFESLHGNDCFSHQASFDPAAVASAALQVHDEGGYYNLRIAVWHHGLHSEPSYRSDYLSIHSVYELIGHGFQLGLHGHQHFAEVGSHYVHLPGERKMAVVSAGSLCAGGRDLPRGVNRQYNVVIVSDDYSEARVHVREMTRGNHFAPSAGVMGFANGLVRMRLSSTKATDGVQVDTDRTRRSELILEAESHLRAGRSTEAFDVLSRVDCTDEPYGRRLLIQAAEQSERWNELAVVLSNPETGDERIQLVEALTRLGRIEDALAHLRRSDGPPLAEHVRRELRERVERLGVMSGRRQ
ncbi:MAG: metallophosphoesterase [Deltaproteobacteria bacterium]|nr:metallophosphoesterase [Deltaproteobacteria bacterium]